MSVMDFFSKLSKKEKVGLTVAGFIVMAVFVDRLMIHPLGVKLQRVDREIAFSEKKLNHDLRNIHNKEFVEGEYQKYKDFIKKNSSSDDENVSGILAEIESLARTAGVSLVDIKPQVPKQIDFYKEYAAEVTIEGSMEQIIVFLHKLNSSPQQLRAVKVRLGLKQKESSSVKASMMVTNIAI